MDAIIVGGGVAGLACGVALSRQGLRVTVLEAGASLGGRAASWADETTGDSVDIGPHILLSEYHNMLSLLEYLGTHHRIHWLTDKFITLVGRPRPVDIRMYPLMAPFHFAPSLLTLPQISWRDLSSNRRLMWRVVRMSDAESLRLDQVTAEEFIRRMGVTEHFIDWFWRSACMSIMNVPLEQCSAGALLRFFRFMIGNSGYRVGFSSVGLSELFLPEAVEKIRDAGGEVQLNAPVAAFTGNNGAVTGVEMEDGSRLECEHCIAAVPPKDLQPLLPAEWRNRYSPFQTLSQFESSPYVSVYLWFDRKVTRDSFWARTWAPDNLNYDFYDLSNIRAQWAHRPSVIASNIIYSHRADQLEDQEIIQITLEELAEYAPEARNARVKHSRIHRIPLAVPAAFPGSERLRPDNRTAVRGFYLAGDWTRTDLPASMESATRSGFLAAEDVLTDRGTPCSIAIAPPSAEGLVRLMGGP